MNRELLDAFLHLHAEVKATDERLKTLKAECAAAEAELRKEFEQEGIQNVKGTDGSLVYLTRTLRANPKNGDRERVVDALRSLGLTEFLTHTFNTSTISSYVREQDGLGVPLPAELAETLDVAEIFQLKVKGGRARS